MLKSWPIALFFLFDFGLGVFTKRDEWALSKGPFYVEEEEAQGRRARIVMSFATRLVIVALVGFAWLPQVGASQSRASHGVPDAHADEERLAAVRAHRATLSAAALTSAACCARDRFYRIVFGSGWLSLVGL